MDIKILIVDDEAEIRELISVLLTSHGYQTLEAASGARALEAVQENPDIDLILMDIMMPGLSGVEACQRIRSISTVPVLFLTAKSQESDKASAYCSGGDDFLAKPFSGAELLMKVDSIIRRYRIYRGKPDEHSSQSVAIGALVIEPETGLVFQNQELVDLTETERNILLYLLKNRERTVSVQEIYESVWHEKYLSTSSNSVMVHILRLRKKIERDPANPEIVRTVWGKGYQFG